MKHPLLTTLGALALALALTAAGSAQAIPLSDLLAGGTIAANDKLFDGWTLVGHTASDGRTFNAANIEVTALIDGGMDPGPGLAFAVSNGELDVVGDGIYGFVDLMFGFHVSVTDPGKKIKDNTLSLTSFAGNYSSDDFYDLGLTVEESVGTAPGLADLAFKKVERSELWDVANPPLLSTSILTDTRSFAPQSELWVTKNILVWAVDAGDNVSLTGFTQRFSQTTVPEPATLALLGLGLGGLGLTRRRKAS